MSVPSYESMMLPLLKSIGDGKVYHLRDAREAVAEQLKLTQEQMEEMYPSGKGPVFAHRIRWAKTYLDHSGLLESQGRGLFRISQRGLQLLQQKPVAINNKLLMQYPEFVDFARGGKRECVTDARPVNAADSTPEDIIEQGYHQLRESLEADLLERVKECPPGFFETLVVDLLVRMGYGGSRRDAGQAIGGSGDGGVDGIIKEDRLGLDVVYIQAKRWDGVVVGRPEVQRFAGALMGKRARKGVFITTSSFSREAVEYAAGIDTKVILIDGAQLAALMVDYSLGVSTVATYEIKNVDLDYFAED